MKMKCPGPLLLAMFLAAMASPKLFATSNYQYKAGEFVVVTDGRAPNGQYSIAAHGEGDLGYDNFHLYLMDARTGKAIGPLEEVKDSLDTGAAAFRAQWSADSRQVSITYRVGRRESVTLRYRIDNGRAILIRGPKPAARG
jgi:hypothetical protein